MAWPSRSLNCAIDLVALVMTGFWPAIWPSSLTAPSISLAFLRGLAHPDIDRDLFDLGDPHGVLIAVLLVSAGTTFFR